MAPVNFIVFAIAHPSELESLKKQIIWKDVRPIEDFTEEDAAGIIDHYVTDGLCLPSAENWLDNIWKLLDIFFLSSSNLPGARKQVAELLFQQAYDHAEPLSQPRNQLVAQVIVPFLEKTLAPITDDYFRQLALEVLVKSAVKETFERDEERRQARATKAESEVQEEDASAIPSQEVKDAAAGGCFHTIRNMIISLSSEARCKEEHAAPVKREMEALLSSPPLSQKSPPSLPKPFPQGSSAASVPKEPPHPREQSASQSSSGSALKGLMSALSPPSRTKELPSVAAPTPSLATAIAEDSPEDISPPRKESTPSPVPPHADCHSLLAVRALISIFNRLAFSPPHPSSTGSNSIRSPASSRCITIYRDLLGLLHPCNQHGAGDATPTSRVATVRAKCPRARIAILQWLLRLRADPKHRIYLRTNIDNTIRPFAETLCRTKEAIEVQKANILADAEEARARIKARQMREFGVHREGARESMRERTMTSSTTGSSRTRSRSRPPAHIDARVADSYNPLWQVPESIEFDLPADNLPSEGLLTYDPNHPSLRVKDAPAVEGVWLPVSEYVACLNEVLKFETDWEVVSYVLCFLPLQLGNKLFFRGARATKEVKKLLKVLCDTIPQDNRIERRCKHHAFIKRPNVNAAVFQALTILISHKDVLDSKECDTLIVAFETCLESNTIVAKPCIQALTLCIFELEQPIGKRLLSIISKMRDINLTSGIAVHLLEFILALGQHTPLFRNFTDAHYKDVFTLVIDYIAEHNARSDELSDMTADKRESYTLSQHVIGLAYHSIYVWFLGLKLALRPELVKHIIFKLLQSRSQRVAVDEMVEVCLDWFARYTYRNADPKPASSFFSEIVLQNPSPAPAPTPELGSEEAAAQPPADPIKRQSWFLDGAIITIITHAPSGWASITSTRPTGATEVMAKIDNVPLSGLEEKDVDVFALTDDLVNRRQEIMEDEKIATALMKSKSTISETDDSSEEGLSALQRRKHDAVDPAYLAIELLSSYADTGADSPIGKFVPDESRFDRSLRSLEGTPVIDTAKFGVLYVGPGQTDEKDILANVEGPPLYQAFLAGLGQLIKLKGQTDVFTGGMNREDDSDGEVAYAWWDDLVQTIFHTSTMMPNNPLDPKFDRKKRLIGNDYVKIVYNDSGQDFKFDTIKTEFNLINIVISPHTTPETHGPVPQPETLAAIGANHPGGGPEGEGYVVWGRDDYFKVILQRAPGIPDFSPVGKFRIVSKEMMPGFVRHVALMANDMAARFAHIRNARDPTDAEYITSWRSRLRTMNRLKAALPPIEEPYEKITREKRLEVIENIARLISQRSPSEEP
ncbi:hypothetical protein I350_00719 [Cryptococcus amylolentus CBS 6273]|uniref:Rap-GAP domain-containing protein n=1 Tax=Cryptococcus amylolentus CBS 6273 TaxID=1296118 RepID=A0A1E3KFZ3_9TREE|nr:hypothetical protein I350_00719 [Cryptococcus amylolentus CBS 6273]